MTPDEIEQGIARLQRGFMTPNVWQSDVYVVETADGTEYVPADIAGNVQSADDLASYCESEIHAYELKRGAWLACLSAAGYMDRTDTSMHESEEEARAYLVETYGDQGEG